MPEQAPPALPLDTLLRNGGDEAVPCGTGAGEVHVPDLHLPALARA